MFIVQCLSRNNCCSFCSSLKAEPMVNTVNLHCPALRAEAVVISG